MNEPGKKEIAQRKLCVFYFKATKKATFVNTAIKKQKKNFCFESFLDKKRQKKRS